MASLKLGEILVEEGKLTREQLETAVLSRNGSVRPLGEVLQELGYVAADDIAHALARQLHIPFFELDEKFHLETEEIRLIPLTIARRYGLVAVKKDRGDVLTLVMSDPLDIEALDTVRSITHMDIRRAVSTKERILAVIEKFYREDAHIERNLRDIVDLETVTADKAGDTASGVDEDQLRVLANDAPVVRFVNLLLMQAVRDRASDIHFEPGEKGVTIRMRIDGILREVTPPPKHIYQGIVTRIKILSAMDIAERRLPLDGRFKFKVEDHDVDIRVSSLPEVYGEKLVLRVLDKRGLVVDMCDIGFDDEMLARFRRVLRAPHGIILLTGPTGSGKTTTLYSALNYLKSPEKNIQTVEDPVEYMVPGVNQMAVRAKIGLDFANCLRAILRQDPNIIMIGEIRDVETARIAMRSSLTGHLVLSTLHTNDATSAFSRLRDIGIEPYLIAATLKLVIAQRLVRILCNECKVAKPLEPEQMSVVLHEYPEAGSWTFYHPVGCASCRRTGFHGRKGVFEFLEVNDSIRQMIIAGDDAVSLRNKAIAMGMQPLLINGLDKVRQGITTVDEVLKVSPLAEIL